jgi:hypothetical protein
MAKREAHQPKYLVARAKDPLIAIPAIEDGEEVVYYFSDEEEARRVFGNKKKESIRRALSLAGAWEYMDREDGPDILDELDRMRHESPPSPPLEL